MASTPPTSPSGGGFQRPMSAAYYRPNTNRSSSRLSMSSKHGGSRASDEDAKTAVKVGQYQMRVLAQKIYADMVKFI